MESVPQPSSYLASSLHVPTPQILFPTLQAAKVAALARRGLPPTAEFPLRVEGMPGGLAAWAAFRAASLTDEAAVEALAARLFGLPLPGSPNSSAEPSGASTASAAAAVWPAEPLPAPVLSALASQQLPPDLESQALREVAALCSAALKGGGHLVALSAPSAPQEPAPFPGLKCVLPGPVVGGSVKSCCVRLRGRHWPFSLLQELCCPPLPLQPTRQPWIRTGPPPKTAPRQGVVVTAQGHGGRVCAQPSG